MAVLDWLRKKKLTLALVAGTAAVAFGSGVGVGSCDGCSKKKTGVTNNTVKVNTYEIETTYDGDVVGRDYFFKPKWLKHYLFFKKGDEKVYIKEKLDGDFSHSKVYCDPVKRR